MTLEDPLLGIGAFARRSRLSMKALRLYDRSGLLCPAFVDEGNGYRWYRESQLETARLVAMLRRLDMPLAAVAEVVAARGADAAGLVAGYWQEVERRVAGQREVAAHVVGRLMGDGAPRTLEIAERDVPAQFVLTEQRHVVVEDLAGWIATSLGRLAGVAHEHGGMAGSPFVVYHGDVNEDGDGPAEACVPVHPGAALPDVPSRWEPAHHEGYVRLRKAQVGFPQILTAFDELDQWASANGLEQGQPREVYFTDFVSAAHSDEVCDVALPVHSG